MSGKKNPLTLPNFTIGLFLSLFPSFSLIHLFQQSFPHSTRSPPFSIPFLYLSISSQPLCTPLHPTSPFLHMLLFSTQYGCRNPVSLKAWHPVTLEHRIYEGKYTSELCACMHACEGRRADWVNVRSVNGSSVHVFSLSFANKNTPKHPESIVNDEMEWWKNDWLPYRLQLICIHPANTFLDGQSALCKLIK